mmetsp:Transcript_23242/g.58736  ORF Transcript_23242/g.58736 Transcript_23242/m.58736 type:complete len:881 (-) Transcript_23242:798-3440(-)|eukprot:CAMPEP_0178986338 /NCGR_PEP_ID=MMETSP0795-20121207/2651_1 /TAXON_ID=88552 /ORGANISM="Amoebophrya sp., Strain Ameob2" /LENGTH=880 /DNA_ID=CAMNT_0020677393 /DNA_START=50 /DNA_END=2692 /DNA_ORIENTATION=+
MSVTVARCVHNTSRQATRLWKGLTIGIAAIALELDGTAASTEQESFLEKPPRRAVAGGDSSDSAFDSGSTSSSGATSKSRASSRSTGGLRPGSAAASSSSTEGGDAEEYAHLPEQTGREAEGETSTRSGLVEGDARRANAYARRKDEGAANFLTRLWTSAGPLNADHVYGAERSSEDDAADQSATSSAAEMRSKSGREMNKKAAHKGSAASEQESSASQLRLRKRGPITGGAPLATGASVAGAAALPGAFAAPEPHYPITSQPLSPYDFTSAAIRRANGEDVRCQTTAPRQIKTIIVFTERLMNEKTGILTQQHLFPLAGGSAENSPKMRFFLHKNFPGGSHSLFQLDSVFPHVKYDRENKACWNQNGEYEPITEDGPYAPMMEKQRVGLELGKDGPTKDVVFVFPGDKNKCGMLGKTRMCLDEVGHDLAQLVMVPMGLGPFWPGFRALVMSPDKLPSPRGALTSTAHEADRKNIEDLLAFATGCDDSNLDASLATLPMTTWSANLRHVVEAGKDFVKAAIVPKPGAQPLPIRNYNCNQVTTWWHRIKAGTLYSAENLPTWCKLEEVDPDGAEWRGRSDGVFRTPDKKAADTLELVKHAAAGGQAPVEGPTGSDGLPPSPPSFPPSSESTKRPFPTDEAKERRERWREQGKKAEEEKRREEMENIIEGHGRDESERSSRGGKKGDEKKNEAHDGPVAVGMTASESGGLGHANACPCCNSRSVHSLCSCGGSGTCLDCYRGACCCCWAIWLIIAALCGVLGYLVIAATTTGEPEPPKKKKQNAAVGLRGNNYAGAGQQPLMLSTVQVQSSSPQQVHTVQVQSQYPQQDPAAAASESVQIQQYATTTAPADQSHILALAPDQQHAYERADQVDEDDSGIRFA